MSTKHKGKVMDRELVKKAKSFKILASSDIAFIDHAIKRDKKKPPFGPVLMSSNLSENARPMEPRNFFYDLKGGLRWATKDFISVGVTVNWEASFSDAIARLGALLWVIKDGLGKLKIDLSTNQSVVLLAIYIGTHDTPLFGPNMLDVAVRKIEVENDLAPMRKQEIDRAAIDLNEMKTIRMIRGSFSIIEQVELLE